MYIMCSRKGKTKYKFGDLLPLFIIKIIFLIVKRGDWTLSVWVRFMDREPWRRRLPLWRLSVRGCGHWLMGPSISQTPTEKSSKVQS